MVEFSFKWPRVTNGAGSIRSVRLVATDAAGHGRDARSHGRDIHLRHVPVARAAVHPCRDVGLVVPGDSWKDLVNRGPGHRISGGGKLGKLHDSRKVLADGAVTSHAGAGFRIPHRRVRCRVGMARFTNQTEREVCLVAIWNRLLRRRMHRRVIGNVLYCRKLLGAHAQRQYEQSDSKRHAQHCGLPSRKKTIHGSPHRKFISCAAKPYYSP